MLAKEITKTVSLKHCQICRANLRDRDKFCRRCGIRQNGRIDTSNSLITMPDGADFQTKRIQPSGSGTLRRSFSRPLMHTLTQELALRTSALRGNRWTIHLFSALVTVPLWLIIVLLSPVDAYVAARAISKHI